MGMHDVPAVTDYILNATGVPSLYYTGHSMGTTMMYVALSEIPELNPKIRLMNSLAPIAYVSHMKSVARYLVPILNQLQVRILNCVSLNYAMLYRILAISVDFIDVWGQ